ncbi:hypothetical protein NXY56_003854 [Leishmania guyanensis]
MPACPDCGLVFGSLSNVQIHRRSGACSMQLGASATNSALHAPQPIVYTAGYPVRPAANPTGYVGFGGYRHGKGGYDMQGAPVFLAEAEQLPHITPIEREIDQALAIQRNRQATDLAERERMMLDQQVNLVLPARQAQLQQSQEALKDQLLQMKLELFTNQQQQQSGNDMDMAFLRNEMAAMRGALSSMSMNCVSNSGPGLTRRNPRKPQQQQSSAARTQVRRERRQHGSVIDEDDSWESLDDVPRSSEYGDDYGEARGGNRSGHTLSPRSVRLLGSAPSQKLCEVLKSMQAEIRRLQVVSATRIEPPFPTASTLQPGLHSLKLATLEGIDLSIPLDEVDVSIKVYYMSYANGEYLLEPSLKRTFPRHPPPLTRHGTNVMLFTVPSLQFIVHSPKEMVVFVLQVLYRGRLLCWSAIFSKVTGSFSEGIQNTSFDLAKALQSPGDVIPGASVSGYIETDSRDVLQRAESILNRSTGNFSASPGPPFSQRQHAQLPGLPPLPPPPQGLPLLPGMPSCEGPFLPPTLEANVMLLQPTNGPVARFILPPPTGVSILEWNEVVTKHLKKMQKYPPKRKAIAPAAEKASDNGKGKRNEKHISHRKPAPPVAQRRRAGPSSSSSSEDSTQSFSLCSSLCSSPSFSNRNELRSPLPPSHSMGAVIEGKTSTHPPEKRQQQRQPHRSHRSTAHFAEDRPEELSVTGTPAEQQPIMPIQEPQKPASEPAAGVSVRKPRSPDAPRSKPQTLPPSAAAPITNLAAKEATVERPPVSSNPPMARPLVPSFPSVDNKTTSPQAETPPPQAPCKVPLEDVSLVERSRLRALTDPQGNLAVPPGYKFNPNNPPCLNLDKLDVTAQPPVNACVLLGLSVPTDAPPATPKAPGHGTKGNTVDVFVDGVAGIPLDAMCSRVLVYISDALDPTTGTPKNPLRHPRVFMRVPDLIAYQNLNSSSSEPKFKAKVTSDVSDQTHAVVIVEYIKDSKGPPIVFGHCCLPINKCFFTGNFVARLKIGDPRRSQERAVDDLRPPDRIADEQKRATEKYNQCNLEASVDSQALRNLLPAPPLKRAECAPLGYLIWRLESPNLNDPFFEMPQQVPLSQQEMQLFEGRKKHAAGTPNSKGVMSEKAAGEAFIGSGTTQTDSLGYITPFSEQRGAFVKVEGIRGVGDDAAMYVVVVYMAKAPKGHRVYYTMIPDWASDVGAPMFKDPPFIFQGIKYDTKNTTTYMLLKLSKLENAATPPVVECIGWTMNRLFLDEVPALRQGRYALAWLTGPLPPDVVKELLTEKVGTVFPKRLQEKSISFLEPKATLTISQGDPACCVGLVDNTPGRAQPRRLLMPDSIKKKFPSAMCEGMVGCTLQRAHEKCFGGGDPRALLQRMHTAVQEYLDESTKTFEEL